MYNEHVFVIIGLVPVDISDISVFHIGVIFYIFIYFI
jgi:hypothetical protein